MCKADAPPEVVVTALRRRCLSRFEWTRCEDSRWYGYAVDSLRPRRQKVLITVALVTGKAVVEVFGPGCSFDILT